MAFGVFFFSSRRRHTRFDCDWSSDVCSSDLQYSLPMEIQGKRADRNLEGVRACILDAVWKAQGKGCGPGFLGVAIGGDRASGFDFAKRQLLRNADDMSTDPILAELENRIMTEANTIDIG